MLKLTYTPDNPEHIIHDLWEVSTGIESIAVAMHQYTLNKVGGGPEEIDEHLITIWPLLKLLMEPISDYFFGYSPKSNE